MTMSSNNHAFFLSDKDYPVRCPATDNRRFFKSQCDASCNNSNVMKAISPPELHDKDVGHLYQFWLFFLCMAVSWAGMAVVVSVGDAICFGLLGKRFNENIETFITANVFLFFR